MELRLPRRLSLLMCLVLALTGGVVPRGGVSLVEGSQEPLTCWTCSSSSLGLDCYNLNKENDTFTSNTTRSCATDEPYCTVVRIWYVAEGETEEMNFSVNRSCAATCDPYCLVIGDSTKIHTCTSCCKESLCNTGNSASGQSRCQSLFLAALLAALVPTLSLSLIPTMFHALTSQLRVPALHHSLQSGTIYSRLLVTGLLISVFISSLSNYNF